MNTGLVHLLVVSGQHFVLLESMLEFLTKKFPSAVRSAVSMIILGAFVLMTGASPPALRSGASWAARRVNEHFHLGWTGGQLVVLSVTLCVPFCHDSGDVLSLSLSGVAAAALAIGTRAAAKNWLERIRAAVTTQIRIYVLLIPALSVFTLQNPLSIIWNLTVGAAVGHFLFPMSLAATIVPGLSVAVDPLWSKTIDVVRFLSHLTPETSKPTGVPDFVAVAYAAFLLSIILLRERRLRSAAIVAILVVSAHAGATEVIVWNVGQGSWATVVRDGTCLHFDSGGEFAPWTQIRATCEGRKNELTFSHWDWDHVSFARRAARQLEACLLEKPGGEAKRSRAHLLDDIAPCPKRERGLVENTSRTHARRASNAESRVFTFEGAIFTGDVPKREERKLLSLTRTRVLVVPHHGSKTSSSEDFLKNVSPLMAIVSARRAVYGHPHREVVDRFRRLGIAMLKTEDWGTIRIETKRAKPFELRPSKKSDYENVKPVCRRDTPC